MKKFSIIGAGGHTKVLIESLELINVPINFIYDIHNTQKLILGYSIKELNLDVMEDDFFIIGIGNNFIRKKVLKEFVNLEYGKIINLNSNISKSADIGSGSVVMAGVSINAECVISKHCIINTNSSIDHECIIGDFAHVSPNSTLCGGVYVGEGTHIGAGAVVIPGIKIGKWANIGAGSVIIRDVPDYATVVGNPGKLIKLNKENL